MADKRIGGPALSALTYLGIAGILGYTFLAVNLGEGFAIPVAIFGLVGGALVLRGPVGKALARKLDAGEPGDSLGEQAAGELDEMRDRILELEERVDFTERMLARAREAEPLRGPQ